MNQNYQNLDTSIYTSKLNNVYCKSSPTRSNIRPTKNLVIKDTTPTKKPNSNHEVSTNEIYKKEKGNTETLHKGGEGKTNSTQYQLHVISLEYCQVAKTRTIYSIFIKVEHHLVSIPF